MSTKAKIGRYVRYILYGILFISVGGYGIYFVQHPNINDLNRFLINAILGLSIFITLNTGLLSLANAGFMALGAYTSAILVAKMGLPLFLSLPLAMLLCGLLGLLIGLPVLRLTDVYLAISTLGFGEVVRVLIVTTPDLTGGATGANLSTGFPFEKMRQTETWMLVLFLLVLIYLFYWLDRSKTGRALRAIRQNSSAAANMGINVVYYRNLAFVMSAAIAGGAGVFYAHQVGSLENGDFRFSRAVDILSYGVLGGTTHWFGPILGAGLLTVLPIFLREVVGTSLDVIRNFAQLPLIINGVALLLVVIFLPGGLFAPSRFKRTPPAINEAELKDLEPPIVAVDSNPPPGESGEPPPLLELREVTQVFGGITAVDNISFKIPPGIICGLIGPNGSGKTTLINLITGIYRPVKGRIFLRGQDITGQKSYIIARMGIARTFQNIRLFNDMTVLENVIVGHHARIKTNLLTTWLRLPRERQEEQLARRQALSLLKRLGLLSFAYQPASKLSYGDQRRVEIARALALNPALLLLDEPAAGMNEVESALLAEFILALKRQGYTVLVIEHHIDLIMQVSNEIIVLNFGKKIAQDVPVGVQQNPQVVEAYFGQE
ncbi:MAG: amino acid/amide transporter rane protein 2, family, amino acid/amide transporter [Chloroflexi bacterium]|jgi:branched-chain amino acid transport system permease protein|nr:amino acid/amide transporter rane protein 2, family, amino acid/amide transporter [Chloroflexota bacterium]